MRKLLALRYVRVIILLCCIVGFHIGQASANEQVENQQEHQAVIEKPVERYVFIYADDEYNYYLDTKTAKQMQHPYLSEDLLDVWIKIVSNTSNQYLDQSSATVMQHYYVRLNQRQMQLINEVALGNDSAFKNQPDIPYSEKKWRTVVPGSSDEGCYDGIIKATTVKKTNKNKLTLGKILSQVSESLNFSI